jgi:hypothetical protein
MPTKQIKVIKIEKVKVGAKGAERLVIHYEGAGGDPWKIGNLASNLSPESRAALTAAKAGSVTLNVNIDKVDGYSTLVSAGDEAGQPEAKPAYSGGGGFKKPFVPGSGFKGETPEEKKDKNARIQAMNTLTSAVNSLGAGKSLVEYKQRAIDLYLIIEDITAQAVAGQLKADPKGNLRESVAAYEDEVVEELGF